MENSAQIFKRNCQEELPWLEVLLNRSVLQGKVNAKGCNWIRGLEVEISKNALA